jgi:hypothetical protein
MGESKVEKGKTCSTDDRAWSDRAELWSRRASRKMGVRATRERPRTPLVLCGHGISLQVEGGCLFIRNGFTHYPR